MEDIKITQKEKMLALLTFLDYKKIKAHVWDYDHRCAVDRDFVVDIWVHKNAKLYYQPADDGLPFTYAYDEDEDDITYSTYYEKDLTKEFDMVIDWAVNKMLKNGFVMTLNNGVAVLSKGSSSKVYIGNGETHYKFNILNAIYEYLKSNNYVD